MIQMKFTNILINYVTRYFLGFLIAFISSILVATVANKSIENYIIQQNEIKTQNGIHQIHETISKMDLINQMIAKNKIFTTIVYQKGKIPQNDVLKLKDANQLFNEIGFASDYIPYMFMLFKNNDLYLSTNQCSFNFDDYYQKFLSVTKKDIDISSSSDFKHFLFDSYLNHDMFVKTDQISYIYNEKKHILNDALLYITTGNQKNLNPMYLSCFVIDRDYIVENILMQELEEQGFLYIQDTKTGNVLLQYGEIPDQVTACKDGEVIGDGKYHVFVDTQEELKWKIVTGVSMDFIALQMRSVNHLLMLYLCIGMILVIGLTLFFSLRRYSGIKKVLLTFPDQRTLSDNKKRKNEYHLLVDNILYLKKTGDDYRVQMEELTRQNEAILLEHLLTTGIRTPEEKEVFQKCFDKEPEFFCVAVVRNNQTEYQNHEMITLCIVEYLHKHYSNKFMNVYSGVADLLFLFELNPDQEANVNGIKRLFEEITVLISAKYDVTFHVGISAIGTELSNISKCYEQAQRIVQAQYACENENVVKTYTITTDMLYENPVNLEVLNRLNTMLISGQQEEAHQTLDRIEHYYTRFPYLYEIHKEQVFYSIRNVLYTAWLNLNGETGLFEKLPTFHSDITCSSMMEGFQQNIDWICDYRYQTKKSKNDGLKQKIIDYLNHHYQDAGLSAYSVSKEIGISEKYLSQFVKEQTGETFSSYLLRIRIEHAKKYLESTDYSNDKIAELTGFGSVNTFYRNFNKQIGVTPKVYKESLKNIT